MKELPSREELARFFHEQYEYFAPFFDYETREDSAVEWEDVPEKNKELMKTVAMMVILRLDGGWDEWK
jgi:hypothetical protein